MFSPLRIALLNEERGWLKLAKLLMNSNLNKKAILDASPRPPTFEKKDFREVESLFIRPLNKKWFAQ